MHISGRDGCSTCAPTNAHKRTGNDDQTSNQTAQHARLPRARRGLDAVTLNKHGVASSRSAANQSLTRRAGAGEDRETAEGPRTKSVFYPDKVHLDHQTTLCGTTLLRLARRAAPSGRSAALSELENHVVEGFGRWVSRSLINVYVRHNRQGRWVRSSESSTTSVSSLVGLPRGPE